MIVSGYSMDLYCRHSGPVAENTIFDAAGHRYDAFPHQFLGETFRECARNARKRGWVFSLGDVTCPQCSGKSRNPRSPPRPAQYSPFHGRPPPEGETDGR